MKSERTKKAPVLAKQREKLEQLSLVLEAFQDDVIPALGTKGFSISMDISNKAANIMVVSWSWRHIEKEVRKEFKLSGSDSAEDFVQRVKAYLFDLIITLINL